MLSPAYNSNELYVSAVIEDRESLLSTSSDSLSISSSESSSSFKSIHVTLLSDWFSSLAIEEQYEFYKLQVQQKSLEGRISFLEETKEEMARYPKFLSSGIYPIQNYYILYDYENEQYACADQEWLITNQFPLASFLPARSSLLLHLRNNPICKKVCKLEAVDPKEFLSWLDASPKRSVPSLEDQKKHEKQKLLKEKQIEELKIHHQNKELKRIEHLRLMQLQKQVMISLIALFFFSLAIALEPRPLSIKF